jgi:hypothetical protein
MTCSKKVSIITIADGSNYGSVLQAFALCLKVRELGYEVDMIHYLRPWLTTAACAKGALSLKLNLSFKLVNLLWIMLKNVVMRNVLYRFFRREFSFTRKVETLDEISSECKHTDIFVTGSDQVWNSYYNRGVDEAYYLNFTDKTKIAYAASIGMDSFPEEEVSRTVSLLRKYKRISLREEKSCDYLESLGLPRPAHCADPTLLLRPEDWNYYIRNKKRFREKYLLVYSVNPAKNKLTFEYARRIAKRLDLKIYVIAVTGYLEYKNKCDRLFCYVGCDTFLRLFRDASFVIASSFHGTAFSINFSKEFISIEPDFANVRVCDIANKLGLADRVVSDDSWNIDDHKKINYKEVQSKLSQWRDESLIFLKNALADA